MNLYVFVASGSYFGGAVGITAETVDEAFEIVKNDQIASEKWWKDFHEGEKDQIINWENVSKIKHSVPFYLEKPKEYPESSRDCFILKHIFPLDNKWETKDIVFSESHEG